jgi:HK97 family phage major capsid protein
MTDRITFAASVAAKGRRLSGGVVLAGSRTWRNGEWLEVDPAALVKADAESVIATWEHDESKVLGAVANGTLRLSRTDQGIDYEIDNLPNTSYANDALELVRGKYVTGTSFEIEGLRSKFSTDPDGKRVRTITSIERLVAVNPVRDPAFVNSHVAAFGKEKDMPEIAEEPPKAPDIKPVEDDKGAAAFASAARGLDTDQLEAVLDSIMASSNGKLEGELLRRYEAFAKEHSERIAADAGERERSDRMKALHDLRLGRITKAPSNETFQSDDYREAFVQYLRTGRASIMEQFAQAIAGDGTQGGFTVPDGFLNRVTSRLKAFGGIAAISDEITTGNGESLRWPSNDDTANSAAIAAEGVAGTAGADLVFGSITLGAFSYSSNGTSNVPLKVSLELLQDASFNIADFVSDKLGERIGRKQASDLAVGAGTTLPFGLLSKTPDTMTATKTRAAAVEHHFQVDSAYRDLGNCRWVMSDTTLAKYWNATDLGGRPLFIPDAQSGLEGQPGSSGLLLGYPVTIDAAAADLVAFGDIRRGYIVRRVRGVEVLVNPFTSAGTRQVEYSAWARMDANIQDSFAYSVSDYASVTADAVA